MTARKSRLLLIIGAGILIVLLYSNHLFSQDRPKPNPQIRTEVHNYFTSNILPDMKAWKTKLDNSMSAADLAELNGYRAEAKKLKSQMFDQMSQFRGKMKGADSATKAQFRATRMQFRDQFMNLAKEVKPLCAKYKTTLQAIGTEAKPLMKTWREDIEKIVEKYAVNTPGQNNGVFKGKGPRGMMGGPGMLGGPGMMGAHGKKAMAVRFMLWDGTDIMPNGEMGQLQEPSALMGVNDLGSADNEMIAYPNPFNNQTTIQFVLPKTTNVNISIFDDKGNLVKSFNGQMNAGENSYVFDGTGNNNQKLPAGTFLYKISSDGYNKTGKIVLDK